MGNQGILYKKVGLRLFTIELKCYPPIFELAEKCISMKLTDLVAELILFLLLLFPVNLDFYSIQQSQIDFKDLDIALGWLQLKRKTLNILRLT